LQGGKFHHLIAQLDEGCKLGACVVQASGQIGFVQYDDRGDVLTLGSGNAARDQHVGESGFGRHDNGDMTEIGRNQLFTKGV